MNFLVPLGLGLALFVIGPLIAHSLRRGSVEQEVLPTLRFIDEKQSSSRNRRTLSDRSLLALRMLLVLLLALLAASPLDATDDHSKRPSIVSAPCPQELTLQ